MFSREQMPVVGSDCILFVGLRPSKYFLSWLRVARSILLGICSENLAAAALARLLKKISGDLQLRDMFL